MSGAGIFAALRGIPVLVGWIWRRVRGKQALLWIAVFIVALVLIQLAALGGAAYLVNYAIGRWDKQDSAIATLIEKIDTMKTARDSQLAAMAATDLRLTHEQGELKAEEAGLREQVKAIRSDMAEIKVSLRDLTRHVLLRDHAEATPNPAWPPAIRDKP